MIRPIHTRPVTILGSDTSGWLVVAYREAKIQMTGSEYKLNFAGHPMDGLTLGSATSWFQLIDIWIDHRHLPSQYARKAA
jgi:hypothetical protein